MKYTKNNIIGVQFTCFRDPTVYTIKDNKRPDYVDVVWNDKTTGREGSVPYTKKNVAKLLNEEKSWRVISNLTIKDYLGEKK